MSNILLVPVHLDALVLDHDQMVVETTADFSRLPYCNHKYDIHPDIANISEELVATPFQNENLLLRAGIHLHWSLPDALTKPQYVKDSSGTGRQVFPLVLNRWLVTRCNDKDVEGLTLNTATVLTLSPTKAQIKDVKQILVMQGTAQPRSLKLTEPPPTTPTAKILSPKQPLILDEGDSLLVKFEGTNFESIQKVTFEGKDLTLKPDPDDKTVLWVEMSSLVTGKKGKHKRIVFVMKNDKEVPFQITVR